MRAIETTAVFEGPDQLRLSHQVPPASGEVRVIVLVPQAEEATYVQKAPDFHAAIGSYYRDFPNEPKRTADEWMQELREGEND